MQPLNPTGATYPIATSGVGNPGSVDIPTDGQDAVQSSTVGIGFKEIINGLAYFSALTLGAANSPPVTGATPPTIATTGYGSGVRRIETYLSLGGSAGGTPAPSPWDCVFYAGYGLYQWASATPQADANGMTIIAGPTATLV